MENTKLPKGTCEICGRTDILLFKRERMQIGKASWPVNTNAPDAILLIPHPNKEGIYCEGGRGVAQEFRRR